MPTAAYLVVSFVIAVSTMIGTGFWVGLSILAAPLVSITAVGGVVVGLRSKGIGYRIGTTGFGLLLLLLAYWLSTKFSLTLFGNHVTGLVWTGIGGLLGVGWGFKTRAAN